MRSVLLILVAVVACSKRRSRADEELGPMPLPNWAVAIPAGWFSIGCSRVLRIEPAELNKDQLFKEHMALESCASDDPPRRLWISAFEIDRLEATETDYRRCIDAGGCDRSYRSAPVMTGLNYHPNSPPGPNRPVFLEHAQASRYCAWRGMRLPTQAEWEKAARGEDERIFAWGDDLPTCERTRGAPYRQRFVKLDCDDEEWFRPVGHRPAGASPYGLLDMEDNAPEWTSDFFSPWGVDEIEIRDVPHRRDRRGDYTIVTLDWSAVRVRWRDPVIDPRGPSVEPPRNNPDRTHPMYVAMGGASMPGINSVGFDGPLIDGESDHAGVRCARSIPGPPPPNVQGPPIGEFAEPFREPGYTGP